MHSAGLTSGSPNRSTDECLSKPAKAGGSLSMEWTNAIANADGRSGLRWLFGDG